MRIFGTREEMLAQGENYESPIGGMFSRAEERFRLAEAARAEARTLREVLASEAAAGGEEELQRLLELETRERDVWGVPRLSAVPTNTRIDAGSHRAPIPHNRNGEEETPPYLTATSEETMLQEYYAMVRQQERGEQYLTQDQSGHDQTTIAELPTDNFPHSMLNAIRTARERELSERDSHTHEMEEESILYRSESPRHELSMDEWWHMDAEHLIRTLTTDDDLRSELNMLPQEASVLLTYFINDVVSEVDRATIDGLLRNPTAIWRTGLPTEWVKRRRDQLDENRRVEDMFFPQDERGVAGRDWADHHNPYLETELIAQAFQMSAQVRWQAAGITPPERLQ
jgi:hypothetical protein